MDDRLSNLCAGGMGIVAVQPESCGEIYGLDHRFRVCGVNVYRVVRQHDGWLIQSGRSIVFSSAADFLLGIGVACGLNGRRAIAWTGDGTVSGNAQSVEHLEHRRARTFAFLCGKQSESFSRL